ncbi:MAG TPA: cell envelope integrity protein CreD [Puia sp.]
MKNKTETLRLAATIWFLSNIIFDAGLLIWLIGFHSTDAWIIVPGIFGAAVGSLPVLVVLFLSLPFVRRRKASFADLFIVVMLICAACALVYGIIGAIPLFLIFRNPQDRWMDTLKALGGTSGVLFVISLISLLLSKPQMQIYFYHSSIDFLPNQHNSMEPTNNPEQSSFEFSQNPSNKILFKGIITAVLIGVMMIPTLFINNLVEERQARQESVVKEVNSRWAEAQTLTGPYIYLPYTTIGQDAYNKPVEIKQHLLIIPDEKQVSGNVETETRLRSIYKVLLYRAVISDKGDFILQVPKDIALERIQWPDARICFGISDFKGIEEKMIIWFNGSDNELSPGLPGNEINEKGLSAPIAITAADLGKPLSYHMNIKLKGSSMLHFVPLSGNSKFSLQSTWPNPSFDGNNLPGARMISDKGFSASWAFNKANLPFGTVLRDFKFEESSLAFGVTMVQPADQYAKTNRSVKYAILVIGLTFSLFFIIELLQQKPIHPVQYVLIGLGLVIFYSLLLAISEFIPFDYAYLIASISTIGLIGFYAKNHFRSWKSAGIFSGVLTLLYGFIFVLIRLEDTALLVGSIGLFIILAITMQASKKVNWYGRASLEV